MNISVKELKEKEGSKVEEISWNISNRMRELGLGISGEIFVLRKIEQYRKAWDKYSIWILLISVSSIAVTGDVVRKYFPINLILLLGLINIAAMEIKIYCHNKRELY